MEKISVVINTLNEAHNLPRLLDSVKGFADEVVVVDMKSDDLTQDIARKFGAKVYEHERVGYVEPARNFALGKATGDWILILDADEMIGTQLANKLKEIAGDRNSYDYYALPRKNIIFGKWIKHSRWWPDYNIRFFKKGVVSWNEVIHSVPMTTGSGMDLPPEENNAIVHFNYSSIEQFVSRMNRYTTQQAKNLHKDGNKFSWKDVIKKPANEFFSRYFQGEGYKDGLHGLVLASLQAASELVLYLKLWELEGFNRANFKIESVTKEIKKAQSEMNYWTADTLVKKSGSLGNRIRRKFKLP